MALGLCCELSAFSIQSVCWNKLLPANLFTFTFLLTYDILVKKKQRKTSAATAHFRFGAEISSTVDVSNVRLTPGAGQTTNNLNSLHFLLLPVGDCTILYMHYNVIPLLGVSDLLLHLGLLKNYS